MIGRYFIVLILLMVTACSSRPTRWNPDDYNVKSGDTLYSIAWRYEIDPDDLARWNKLSNTTLIRPGQRLQMKPTGGKHQISNQKIRSYPQRVTKPVSSKAKTKTVVVKQDETLYSIARKHKLSVKQLSQYNNIKKPYLIKPGQRLKLSGATTHAISRPKQIQARAIPADRVNNNKVISWKWPVKGKLLKSFNRRLNDAKGIDIAGVEGKRVKAAAAGKVVYSGNGLISYGNLIIIKHNAQYLSAYAHSRKLLVKEGQFVKTGQVIAELGKTGTEIPKLHFEIRKNGKPVNPVRYLPSS